MSDYKIIISRSGDEILVDSDDYEELNKYTWNSKIGGKIKYVGFGGGRYGMTYMHRLIMGAKKDEIVDHINRNTLDNRKSNLRLCTKSNNSMNREKQISKTSSKYKGVSWNKHANKWQVHLTINGKKTHIGLFADEDEAGLAYNREAEKYYGEYRINNTIE